MFTYIITFYPPMEKGKIIYNLKLPFLCLPALVSFFGKTAESFCIKYLLRYAFDKDTCCFYHYLVKSHETVRIKIQGLYISQNLPITLA